MPEPDETPSAETRLDPIELFSPAVQEAVIGLTYLGYLTETFRFCGHSFTIETLRPNVKYAISMAMQPYRNTFEEPNVYAAFQVAMALTSVDGRRDFCPPIGETLLEHVEARFAWLTVDTKWLQPLIDYVFVRYMTLERKAQEAILELQSLSERGPATSQPSPDSSTGPVLSTEETPSDIPLWEGSN